MNRSAPCTEAAFAKRLLAWFDQHGRHDLPWQTDRSAYRVWVSEIMLQQTQVTTVVGYFQAFMASFPDVKTLAAAPVDHVLHHWSGLGYYARARNLHKAAVTIVQDHAGECPDDVTTWVALPGVGPSTAAAIVAQAFDRREAILDGNVKRVLSRYHGVRGWYGQRATENTLWDHAWAHTPHERLRDYTQAIMDLGATLCTRGKPRCDDCPVAADCYARLNDVQSELPERKPKKEKPVRQTTMLIVRDSASHILLKQRPPSGIWGGLWSLPELEADQSPRDWCRVHLQAELADECARPVLRHTFSHFHLDISPVDVTIDATSARGVEEGAWVWYNRSAPAAIGLAAPVAKLLAEETP
ncbi:MAG: A/G-specific adenine glycosylase [Gammaproteobacteria bacterium]